MQGLLFVCCLIGSVFSYDGKVDNKHYFQVNTPEADYGFILDLENEPYLYCDTIYYRR